MGFVVLCVFQQHFVHVCAGILEQFVRAVENDEGYLTVTQYAQLIGLFHQAKLPLCEGNLRDTQKTKACITEKNSLNFSISCKDDQIKGEKNCTVWHNCKC